MPRTREDTVENRYAALCRARNQKIRNSCLQMLNGYLSLRAGRYGVNHDSLTARFRRKGYADPQLEATGLLAAIQTRRLEILCRIAEIGSGNWRNDLEAYVKEVDTAFDHLFILGDEEGDNLWAELMVGSMFKPVAKSRTNDWAGRLRDAMNEIVATMLMDSRAALTAAVTRPRDGVTLPVCSGYCRKAVINRLRGEAVREAMNIPFNDAMFSNADADCDSAGESDGADISDDDSFVAALLAGAGEAEESDDVVSAVMTLDDALVEFFKLPSDMQHAIVQALWSDLQLGEQQALWLSRVFQHLKAANDFPGLRSPLMGNVRVGSGIGGAQAAGELGIDRGAFHARVNRAKAAFGECLVAQVNRAILTTERH